MRVASALCAACFVLCAARGVLHAMRCVLHVASHASAVRVTSVFSSVPSTGHAQQRMSQRRVGDQHKEHASGATLSICTCGLRVLVSTGTMGRGNPREGGSCAMRCTTAFERGAPLTQHTLPRSLPFALPKRLGASEEEVVHAERTAARRTNSAGRTNPTHSDTQWYGSLITVLIMRSRSRIRASASSAGRAVTSPSCALSYVGTRDGFDAVHRCAGHESMCKDYPHRALILITRTRGLDTQHGPSR